MRRIAVIGLSTFGTLLVRTLAEERCYVLAVDLNEQKINMIRDVANEAAIADARDPRALEALRLHEYDVVVLSLGEPLERVYWQPCIPGISTYARYWPRL